MIACFVKCIFRLCLLSQLLGLKEERGTSFWVQIKVSCLSLHLEHMRLKKEKKKRK
uniref:Uncharacterized protein n=1 Tax=Anguilla anguilla TaxID=7936 RepID=A0A0E9XWH3_ANGAN